MNKIIPKSNKIPLVNQYNSDEFFEKLKNQDEDCYKEFIKLIMQYKDDSINNETLTKKTEEILGKYPDLLEEAMLFIDYKRLNVNNYKKNLTTKNNINNNNHQNIIESKDNKESNEKNESSVKKETKTENKKMETSNIKEKQITNDYSFPYLTPKIKMSPEYIFFNGLKEIFPPEIYEILIKILYLYIEGIRIF